MPTVQIYDSSKDARVFDGHLCLTLSETGYKQNLGFCKGSVTRILKRFGYLRQKKWLRTEWGWQAKFTRRKELK